MPTLPLRFGVYLALASGLAFAQAPAFEVVSIKASAPFDPAMIVSGKAHLGMKIDKGRVDIGYFSLADLIRTAYRVKPHQVSGPDWMAAQRFDIVATLSNGTSPEQAPEMLQALLADRFKLKIHRESKEQTVFALLAGKDGPKLKESLPDPDPPAGDKAHTEAKGGIVIGSGDGQVRVEHSNNGTTMTGPNGPTKMTMGPGSVMHMEAAKMTLAALADTLTAFLGRPVVDETGLKGNYQIALDLSMEDLRSIARKAGVVMPGMPGTGGPGKAQGETASDPSGGSIFAALQELGLKLETKKSPIDIIVIDHLEKTPTD